MNRGESECPLSNKWIAVAAIAAAGCLLAPAVASAGVVVAASGPSARNFPVGKTIGDSERIVLRAGDTLTVLDGNGTRVLRGAGTYLARPAGRTQQAGLLRSADPAPHCLAGPHRRDPRRGRAAAPSSLWYVDVGHAGTVCLAGTDRVRLWRPATTGDATYSLRADARAGQSFGYVCRRRYARPVGYLGVPIADGASFASGAPKVPAEAR